MGMFCFQCEQTARGKACTNYGVCGKDPEVAALQDLLVHAVKGIAVYAHLAQKQGLADRELDAFVIEALFTTVTNVNFDAKRMEQWLRRADGMIVRARELCGDLKGAGEVNAVALSGAAAWRAAGDFNELVRQGEAVSIEERLVRFGYDIGGLQELLMSGLKGTAAYAEHARILGREDAEVYAFFHEALSFLAGEPRSVDDLLAMNLRCGEVNLRVMALLDGANTGVYGHPVPTKVRITPLKGKAILVSGHDLKDLEILLKQTEGKGINVYTHGEMLPAHGYPLLKQFKHLAGNYGGAWQDQAREFDEFPGAILMTTNCIQKPKESYKGRIFTSGLVAWPGVIHISDQDFSPVIQAALAAPGFAADEAERTILVGFGHNAVLGVADKVVAAVKSGAIKHFFLIGGCDGAKPGRNYYTDFARSAPKDTVILTLACGKYRFNKEEFGDIGGIPRLLDIGQCNDAYSAIQIAAALSKAFGCGVNDLPLSIVLSWYEQKAVCILLTLLYLGIKNIRLGPTLPAFVSPNVLSFLVKNYGIAPITTPEKDLADLLQ